MTDKIPEAIRSLCSHKKPYSNSEEMDQLFVEAMQEVIRWHRKRCTYFAKLLVQEGIDENNLKTVSDCATLPLMHANFFKTHTIRSIPEEDVVETFTSSGTTGQKSQMFFDDWSMGAGRRMIDYIYDYYGWNQPDTPANYLLYTYETLPDSELGTAATDNFITKYAKANRRYYALRFVNPAENKHEFDCFGAIEALKSYEKEGLPVRILGFPSFMYFTLKRMEALDMNPLKLHPDSITSFGGGWKGHADQQIPKQELYEMIEYWLGFSHENCRDGYGSVEHAIPYFECKKHQFHVPVWSRAFIRDPKTLEIVPDGEPGFIHFVTPYITSVAAVSVMMGDLAVKRPGSACDCELETPFFEILGRAGTAKTKSCAIAASELLAGKGV